jgi:hypothetical protein
VEAVLHCDPPVRTVQNRLSFEFHPRKKEPSCLFSRDPTRHKEFNDDRRLRPSIEYDVPHEP